MTMTDERALKRGVGLYEQSVQRHLTYHLLRLLGAGEEHAGSKGYIVTLFHVQSGHLYGTAVAVNDPSTVMLLKDLQSVCRSFPAVHIDRKIQFLSKLKLSVEEDLLILTATETGTHADLFGL